MIKEAHCPFGRIEIWQLIHALLEVSWHFYTKNKDVNLNEGFPGNLANGLHKFLVNNIYPNFGKSLGKFFAINLINLRGASPVNGSKNRYFFHHYSIAYAFRNTHVKFQAGIRKIVNFFVTSCSTSGFWN